jgi:hypothetical protein
MNETKDTKIYAVNKLSVNRGISLNGFIAAVQIGNEVCDRFVTAVYARMILYVDMYLNTDTVTDSQYRQCSHATHSVTSLL